MTDLQWEILDQLYFMNSYQTVRENVVADTDALNNSLVELLSDGMLRQLVFSDTHRDFVDLEPFDASRFQDSQFVITKQGLLKHTGAA